MRLLVFFVTQSSHALNTFKAKKAQLEQVFLENTDFPTQLMLCPFSIDDKHLKDRLEEVILKEYQEIDGVLLLIEEGGEEFYQNIKHSLFVGEIPRINYCKDTWNLLSKNFRILFKNYIHYYKAASHSDNYQALTLPIRNFNSIILTNLLETLSRKTMAKDFLNLFNESLSKLKRSRHPKRRSKSREQFYVDDNESYFQYGLEKHGNYETGFPHLRSCQIKGLYRFGFKMEQGRHFNMTSSAGFLSNKTLFNCHGETVSIKKADHINIFSNDFVKTQK